MFRQQDRDKCGRLFEKYYSGRRFFDGHYRDLIAAHLKPGSRLLDAGCGRHMKYCGDLAGLARVVGIDFDEPLETDNSEPPFGVRGDIHRLPFPSDAFDIVISRSVVEHLADPAQVFREWNRVLRPGGKVVILTPNKYDYVSLLAAVTPHWFHRALVSRIFQVSEDDIFPTLYRANTMSSLRRALGSAGMQEIELRMLNHYPAYLMFSPVLFRIGVAYERLTGLRMFERLRGAILCVFQKPQNVLSRNAGSESGCAALTMDVKS